MRDLTVNIVLLSIFVVCIGGHVEHTIDQLLQMGVQMGGPPPVVTNPPPPTSSPKKGSKGTPQNDAAAAANKYTVSTSSPTEKSKRWRTKIPDNFLVMPIDAIGPSTDQELQDAMITQMLQDELFIAELRQHPEFNDYIEQERRIMNAYARGETPESIMTPSRRAAALHDAGIDTTITDRLGKLGVYICTIVYII